MGYQANIGLPAGTFGAGHGPAWARVGRREERRNLSTADLASASRDRVILVHAAAEAREALRQAATAAAEAAARARSVADELDRALATLNAVEAGPAPLLPPAADCSSGAVARLSPREREVLALVAEGRSNKAIAEALFVSPNTVKTHVASLLTKLDADTRVQLAALAAQQCVN